MTQEQRTGLLKVLAGPKPLVKLMKRGEADHRVTLDGDTLSWGKAQSPGGQVAGDQILSVVQRGTSFVVRLNPGDSGVDVLTFGASSKEEAQEWADAVRDIATGDEEAPPMEGSFIGPKGLPIAKNWLKANEGAPEGAGVFYTPPEGESPITVTYTHEGESVEKQCELLVIACDPRNLIGVCDYAEDELAIFKELTNYTFHTTLLEVEVPGPQQKHGVIFAPAPLDELDGSVYGFRNESAKQFGLDTANAMSKNLVTVYQLLGSREDPWDSARFEEVLKAQLPTLPWWPFGNNYMIRKSVTTPYFNHFNTTSLKRGLPWELLQRQGQKQTLLVHASTCFESVLHCWGYANLMLRAVPAARKALPASLDAPIVILGAGVSGLLFAARLTREGYTNVQILETTQRYGGKTHTLYEEGPYPEGSQEKTVCELGTCYMSPAYDPMIKALKEYLVGNTPIDFTKKEESFRGIVTTGELPDDFDVDLVIPYSDYVILKAEALDGLFDGIPGIDKVLALADLAYDLGKYALLHLGYMGRRMPMPSRQPDAFQDAFGDQSFMDFLEDHGLLSMVGMLQYGYEVQGYGSLKEIPAYYGLVWITPAITNAILLDGLHLEEEAVVTAWTQGWLNLWDQIVEKQNLNITLGAQTTKITRS